VLQAGRLGVVGALACPDPLTTDGFEQINTDVSSAPNLSIALDHLEADADLVHAVGEDLVANFLANKRAEWDRYKVAIGGEDDPGVITDWELSEYRMYH